MSTHGSLSALRHLKQHLTLIHISIPLHGVQSFIDILMVGPISIHMMESHFCAVIRHVRTIMAPLQSIRITNTAVLLCKISPELSYDCESTVDLSLIFGLVSGFHT